MIRRVSLRSAFVLRRARFFLGLAASLGLAACTGSPSPPTYVEQRPVATRPAITAPTAPGLPPTWTPTYTLTPRPPTPTPTLTPTSPVTVTPDPTQLCQRFNLFAAPSEGVLVAYDGRVAYGWRGAPDTMMIYLTILHREAGEGILVQWPPGQSFNMTVDMSDLPYAGVYDWELALHDETQGDLCPVKGWFERLPEYPTPTPTEHWVFPPTSAQ